MLYALLSNSPVPPHHPHPHSLRHLPVATNTKDITSKDKQKLVILLIR